VTNDIGADGVLALLESGTLSALRELDVSGCNLDDQAVRKMAATPGLARISALGIGYNCLAGDEGLAALAALWASPHVRGLARIDLREMEGLEPGWLASLAEAAPNLAALEALWIEDTDVDAAQLEPLSASSLRLSSLVAERNPIGDEGCRLIAGSPVFAGLELLNLAGAEIGSDGIAALAGANLAALRVLRLSGNPVDKAAAKALLASETLPRLEELDLSDTGLSKADKQSLRDSRGAKRLKTLTL